MYPNLLGQKAVRHMSNEDMAKVIHISRTAYESKIKSGRFTPAECIAYTKFFNKPFDYLFAMDE